jgi:hypothetical protein
MFVLRASILAHQQSDVGDLVVGLEALDVDVVLHFGVVALLVSTDAHDFPLVLPLQSLDHPFGVEGSSNNFGPEGIRGLQ